MISVSLAVLALMAWVVMIVFAIVPKGLTITELLFLYFVIVIATITLFTTLDVNLHWATITRSVEGSFAMYICRLVFIPLLVLMGACVLLSRLNALRKVVLFALVVLALGGADRIYLRLDLLNFEKWNSVFSILMYGTFVVLVWWIARWFTGLDKGGADPS
jgi:hypothetical protein